MYDFSPKERSACQFLHQKKKYNYMPGKKIPSSHAFPKPGWMGAGFSDPVEK